MEQDVLSIFLFMVGGDGFSLDGSQLRLHTS